MASIEKDPNYMEGKANAERVIDLGIEKTMYETLDAAVNIKRDMVEQFEETFQFDRNTGPFDRNYAYNVGMLDAFKNALA